MRLRWWNQGKFHLFKPRFRLIIRERLLSSGRIRLNGGYPFGRDAGDDPLPDDLGGGGMKGDDLELMGVKSEEIVHYGNSMMN